MHKKLIDFFEELKSNFDKIFHGEISPKIFEKKSDALFMMATYTKFVFFVLQIKQQINNHNGQ